MPACEPDPFRLGDCEVHWKRLLAAAQLPGVARELTQYWDALADDYQHYSTNAGFPALSVLEPFLAPEKTMIDVGCGPGHELPALAKRVARVTAVEPSTAMARHIAPNEKVTLVCARWQDAEVKRADIVYSSLVINFMPDAVAFIRKMERCARERCFLHVLDNSGRRPLDPLFKLLSGEQRPRSARFIDVYKLLRCMGVRPFVVPLPGVHEMAWRTREAALRDCCRRLAPVWRAAVAEAWLTEHLRPAPDGGVRLGDARPTAVAHWAPTLPSH